MTSSRALTFRDQSLYPLWEKIRSGVRLSKEDGLALFASDDLIGVGRMANEVAREKSGDFVYFVLNRKLEPTNICVLSCKFCDFAVKPDSPEAYEMTVAEMLSKLRPDLHEVHITGGLHPKWPWQFYLDMVREIKTNFPNVDVKAFTAVEIDFFSKKFKKSHEQVLRELWDAGLRTMPGGGAEVFSERVRKHLFHQKIGAKTWFDVHRTAHRLGIQSNVTMLYGHIETIEERVEHMLRVRECQDETHGFLSFIPLAFQPGDTGIKTRNDFTSAIDDLKTIAVSRLMLDNVPHIKAYWVMLTAEVATIALNFGADDMDGTVGEERIAHDAGAISPMELAKGKLISIIHDAGKLPVERDIWYNPIALYPKKEWSVVSKMPYLNSVPFYNAFPDYSNVVKLAPLAPRVFGKLAQQGSVAAGPMSLRDYMTLSDDFEKLDYGVAVKGKANSVLIFSKYDWQELAGKKIAITSETSTSVELLRVLLEKRFGIFDFAFHRTHPSDQTDYSDYDAVLLIGDEALRKAYGGGIAGFDKVFDLAEEWCGWKEMPFVFAVWAIRKETNEIARNEIIHSLEDSLENATEPPPFQGGADDRSSGGWLGREHGARLGMSEAEVADYLSQFRYRFTLEEHAAMAEFEMEYESLQSRVEQAFSLPTGFQPVNIATEDAEKN
ncbi:MAG TPA: aminofutalosine synthase MqnE [Candidatus Kapabacteria bacterium]|nr:aminofutalosine synthase MqnE [Candidatus Kapabacteria bacterium]